MSIAAKFDLMSIETYLANELCSPIKHEYLGGAVYAMAGTRNAHNDIAGNIFAALHARLRSQNCRPYNSDTKIRIRLPSHIRFYYPDVSVTCRPNPPSDSFQDEPSVVFEVLSKNTRRTDEGEKKEAYLTIPSLSVYVLIEQEIPAAVAYRRAENGFVKEVYQGMEAAVPLREIGLELPLAEIYETVQFLNEVDEA